MTLPLAINDCRTANDEKPLSYLKGPIADLLAYMAFESRGQITQVEIPNDDPRALEAYEKGKNFYFARRGQLNFSCAHCHLGNSGTTLRTEILSPALGHTTHWPVYRSKWGEGVLESWTAASRAVTNRCAPRRFRLRARNIGISNIS